MENDLNEKLGCCSVERAREILSEFLNASEIKQAKLRQHSWALRIAISIICAYERGKIDS